MYKKISIKIYVCLSFSVPSVNLYSISLVNWIPNPALNVNDETNGNQIRGIPLRPPTFTTTPSRPNSSLEETLIYLIQLEFKLIDISCFYF